MSEIPSNTQFVDNLMNFSRRGALAQLFVLEALRYYSEAVLASEDWGPQHFISHRAWKDVAAEIKAKLDERYEATGEKSDVVLDVQSADGEGRVSPD